MHVLHFFKTYWPDSFGGMERTIHAIVKSTARHGVTCEVLSLSRKPKENAILFDGHWARKARLTVEVASTGFSLDAVRLFKARAREAEIVHYHFPWPYMDAAHFLARHRKPAVVTYHSDVVKQKKLMTLYRPLMRRFLSDVDRIVCTSPNYLETSEDLRPFRDKVAVIENGLEESDYPTPGEELLERWRARFPAPFFLFTGVLRYYKGLHVLIDAARLCGVPVVIVGEGPMGKELNVQAIGADNVHFVGAVADEDKTALLSLCRAFVFPSHLRSEAFGLSLVEAAMFEKPMISCEIGTGTSHVNLDGETGIVVPPSDPSALAEAMRKLERDPELARRYGKAARRRYIETFTAASMGEAYHKLYSKVCDGRR